jgi:hypothetical protein
MMEIHVPNRVRFFVLVSAILASTALAGKAQAISLDYDGSYEGSMTLVHPIANTDPNRPASVYTRSISMQIDRGSVTVWYADQAGNIIHYRGAVEESGSLDAWHRNSDGTYSTLLGGSGGPGFFGYLDRNNGHCHYKIIVTRQDNHDATG